MDALAECRVKDEAVETFPRRVLIYPVNSNGNTPSRRPQRLLLRRNRTGPPRAAASTGGFVIHRIPLEDL
jgi:hypothetical protein